MRSLSADMEVLYWKHVKEQLETLRKLQRREVNTGQSEPTPHAPPSHGGIQQLPPHRCSCTGG